MTDRHSDWDTDWKKVYLMSRERIRAQAVSGMFVAAVYAIIGILGLALLAGGRASEVPLGVLFTAIGVLGGGYFGYQAYREYTGDPLLVVLKVRHRQEMLSYSRTGAIRRHVLQAEINRAFRVNAAGETIDVPAMRWDNIPVTEAIYRAVSVGDVVTLACTSAGVAFATLDSLVES